MQNFFDNLLSNINLFDTIFFIVMIYSIIQCFLKGFSLSFVSFMKWVLSLVITIILVPKAKPWVNEYIESDFINNIGLAVFIFVCVLFVMILIGKSLSRVITFYPYQNWGISAEEAKTFEIIKNGSDLLIEEFPDNEDFINTKEEIEKI